jgi:MoxR-like ATPase
MAANPPAAVHTPEQIARLADDFGRIRAELAKVIVGHDAVIEQLFIALLSGGHCILEGVPGLAKTKLVASLAGTLRLSFARIQFTPDLMPADITGTQVIDEDRATGRRELRFVPGPIFASVILADEINRTPPKTQSALLEAMQEHQVTAGGERHGLPRPFFVLATQNPIEHEGTYPLPEAALDRFLLKALVDYPSENQELAVVQMVAGDEPPAPQPVLGAEQVLAMHALVRAVLCAEHVARYALRLVRATRPDDQAPAFVREYLAWGAGPRAAGHLLLAAKARAALTGRLHVAPQDVAAVAHPVLRHRLLLNFNADAEGVRPDQIVDRLLAAVRYDHTPGLKEAGAERLFKTGD